ncbi:MAG: hypothetical protein MUE50_05480 [Pirellulaceae bacterium]|jgi:hypothetical protein|nr:hypothetical protein [Pirellulaceae bacterium]
MYRPRYWRAGLICLAIFSAAGAAVQVSEETTRIVGKYFRLDDPTWDDLRIVPGAFDYAGSNDPALQNWQPGGSGTTFKVYEFEAGDGGYFAVQLPHNRKPGTDLSAHVHWTPAARGNEENAKTVAWKIDISSASIDGTFPASSVYDLTDTTDGTDHKHQMTPAATVPASALGLSSMLQCRVFRDAGDSWATNTSGNCPVLLEVDFHYQIDRFGSDNLGSND